MAVDYYRSRLMMKHLDLILETLKKDINPITVFDVIRQERLKNSPIDIRIQATFKDNFPDIRSATCMLIFYLIRLFRYKEMKIIKV